MSASKKGRSKLDPEEKEELVEQMKVDPEQVFRLFQWRHFEGQKRAVDLGKVIGFDPDYIRETFGGGQYQLKPIDESGRFIPGVFSVSIGGPMKTMDQIFKPVPVEPTEDSDLMDNLAEPGGDKMLAFLLKQNQELMTKIEALQTIPRETAGGFDVKDVESMVDAIMKKQMVYSAMVPLINKMGGKEKSEKGMAEMFEMFLGIMNQGIKLGQGIEPYHEETHKETGLAGVIERFLPSLFDILSRPKMTTPVAQPGQTVPDVPAAMPNVQTQEDESVFKFDLPQRINRAIGHLIECLASDLEMTVEDIAAQIGRILSPDDVKVIGDNLSYEQISELLVSQGKVEANLILRENEALVKSVITVLKGGKVGGPDTPEKTE